VAGLCVLAALSGEAVQKPNLIVILVDDAPRGWDVSLYRSRRLRLRVVDRHTGGWGHLTFDDFSADGTLVRD
jgi:hypothetical protein